MTAHGPNSSERAALALLAGNDAVAVAGYRAAIAAAPADVDARYGLASALAASGDGAGAGAALEEARLLQGLLLAKGMGVDLSRIEAMATTARPSPPSSMRHTTSPPLR